MRVSEPLRRKSGHAQDRAGWVNGIDFPYTPGSEFPSEEELLKAAGRIGTTIFHPIGTCRMGRENDESAVVDTKFRMRGLERLRVIDASIMPTITSGNTNSPTVMVAERGSGMLM